MHFLKVSVPILNLKKNVPSATRRSPTAAGSFCDPRACGVCSWTRAECCCRQDGKPSGRGHVDNFHWTLAFLDSCNDCCRRLRLRSFCKWQPCALNLLHMSRNTANIHKNKSLLFYSTANPTQIIINKSIKYGLHLQVPTQMHAMMCKEASRTFPRASALNSHCSNSCRPLGCHVGTNDPVFWCLRRMWRSTESCAKAMNDKCKNNLYFIFLEKCIWSLNSATDLSLLFNLPTTSPLQTN